MQEINWQKYKRHNVVVQKGAWKNLVVYLEFSPYEIEKDFNLEIDSRYAMTNYRKRRTAEKLPQDKNVLYVHTYNRGVLIHLSELLDKENNIKHATEKDYKKCKIKYEFNIFKKKKLESQLFLGMY